VTVSTKNKNQKSGSELAIEVVEPPF